MVGNEKTFEIPMGNNYCTKWCPHGECWNDHILFGEERENVTFLDDLLDSCEVWKYENASGREAVMQEIYDQFMTNGLWELNNLSNDCKSVGYKWVFRTIK